MAEAISEAGSEAIMAACRVLYSSRDAVGSFNLTCFLVLDGSCLRCTDPGWEEMLQRYDVSRLLL